MPQEQGEEVLRFFALLSPSDLTGKCQRKFFTFDEADLVDGFDVKMRQSVAAFSDYKERLSFSFPLWSGYCCVGDSLFLVGGLPCKNMSTKRVSRDLLRFQLDASPSPGDCSLPGLSHWRIHGSLLCGRQQCLAVPYDGKIFIFGGRPNFSAEIFDPTSVKQQMPMVPPKGLGMGNPNSYFLWRDKRNPHKKPLIVLYCPHCGRHDRLFSYDVEKNHWELLDSTFPIREPHSNFWPRTLVPLDGSDFLLVMDYADHWSIYDLSSKNVVGEVKVQGFKKDGQVVAHAFWQCCFGEGSMIFYIFMDGIENEYELTSTGMEKEYQLTSTRVPYAKVRLLTEGEKFVATVELQGVLEVDEYDYICMFAEKTTKTAKTKRTLDEARLSGGEDGKKMKL